ncbi:amidohydrolase family protein [Pollutibacter soli]|uniref:amidohydrolase family protein n=1 Tax=Pollutibacter soli TaxID=3034157 RepID=UPI003013A5B0
MRKLLLVALVLCISLTPFAQPTFPVNGVADPRDPVYAFTHATIQGAAQTQLKDATLLIRNGKIIAVGNNVAIPKEALIIDCSGKYIYPSFIDLYSDYGIPVPQRTGGGVGFFGRAQLTSDRKGAYGWNQAIRSDVQGSSIFSIDNNKAKQLRDQGFGTVLTHQKDGIARGTGVLVTLNETNEHEAILKEKASSHYSFSKGTSTQSYPSSMMGSIALLRQSFIDAAWYKDNVAKEGINLTLDGWNNNLAYPKIFEANDKWNALRADRVGDEFGVQFIIKGGGNEYQRITEMAGTKASFIVPLNFPQAMDVEDPNDARFVSITDLKHWELAPGNPAAFEKAGINFTLTTADLSDVKTFWTNLRKALEYGLSEEAALAALTKNPATILGINTLVGTIEQGKLANFLITSGPIFNEKTVILQNWVQGKKYAVKEDGWNNFRGRYNLTLKKAGAATNYVLDVKSAQSASVIAKDTVNTKFSFDGKIIKLSFGPDKKAKSSFFLSGVNNGDAWNGTGTDTSGSSFTWTATLDKLTRDSADSIKKKPLPKTGKLMFPFQAYGWDTAPVQETILIKNATVWTNESAGKLENTDVLVKAGKIVQIGKNLSESGARVIDGTGKHLTAGVIDEHSHIAAASINEGGQSVTSEVRIADNLDPDDIDIYRQLSGGVTSSHILHGSANTIGGQTQLIKLRWGANDDQLKFQGAPGFIKFALGENVKRSSATQGNPRFPDTRMGVEEVLTDAFTRAKDYQAALQRESSALKAKKGATDDAYKTVRRDLELEALVEILNKKRFITCHSYVQSEITAALRVADKLGFTFNTFTHILEGYKVADKMKAQGSNASTFSDWWAYKMEVQDAIPYNATIMQRVGLNVAINSDDAEMARRLNQEAAKSVKYGGMSEDEALKMVTLNPAKMLHVDDKVGSIKVGKDADLVLWTAHPLSIYAMSDKTIVDGIVYFDRTKDLELRKQVSEERNRLIQKMIGEKKGGGATVPARPSFVIKNACSEHDHNHGLLAIDQVEGE